MGLRVMITGISGLLAARVAQALEASNEVDFICGVGLKPPPISLDRTEFIKADVRSPLIYKVLTGAEADTVVHADLISTPSNVGGRAAQKERNVIGSMQLLAACQRAEGIKKVIVRSSTAVYGSHPGDPSILTEERSEQAHVTGGYARDVADAETFARDFGRRRPDVSLTILRMANIVGPQAETNMTQLFTLPFIPMGWGYDPRLQLLHEEDAIEVLRRATLISHPGVFNVAADGVIYLSQAIRMARRFPLPVATPLASIAGEALRRIGAIDFPMDQIQLLVHGRVVDTTRLKRVFGYEPKFNTYEAFADFLRSGDERSLGPQALSRWERDVYDAALAWSGKLTGQSRPYLVHDDKTESL